MLVRMGSLESAFEKLKTQLEGYDRIVESLMSDRSMLLDRLMARDLPEFATYQPTRGLKDKLEELIPEEDELNAGGIVAGGNRL